jgi:hypothetical protein
MYDIDRWAEVGEYCVYGWAKGAGKYEDYIYGWADVGFII